MDKKICFAVVCALAVVYGCDDDAGLGSKVVETCTRPGETKCTTEGARVVCQDGVYVPSACESNEACVAGECVRRCDVATFPKDCDGNVSVTCGPDGYVVRKPCDGTCVGGDCRSTQSGGNVGDDCDASTFEGRCDADGKVVKCVGGKIVKRACESSNLTCYLGKCEKLAPCGESTYTPKCIDGEIGRAHV